MHIRSSTIAVAILAGSTITYSFPTTSDAASGLALLGKRANTYEDWCEVKSEDREKIWNDDGLGVGSLLDTRLRVIEDGWLRRLEDEVKGDTGMLCTDKWGTQECDPIKSCGEYWEAGQAHIWWIFRAVSKFYYALGAIASHVESETLSVVLNIEKIADTFGEEMHENAGPFGILSAVFGIAGAAASSHPAAAAAAGIFSGISSLMGEIMQDDEETPNNRKDIEEALSLIYENQKAAIEVFRKLVIESDMLSAGKYWETSDLPMQTGNRGTGLGRFFDGGKWLLDWQDSKDMIEQWTRDYRTFARQGIITSLLKKQDYFVYIMRDVKDKNECNNKYERDEAVRTWIDGAGCADFFQFSHDHYTEGKSAMEVDKEKTLAMREDEFGGLSFNHMFKNAIDCAKKHPNGKGKIDRTKIVKKPNELPECFFNYPVVEGKSVTTNRNEHRIEIADGQINTSNRETVSE